MDTDQQDYIECQLEGLNLFDTVPLQSSVSHAEWVETKPLTSIDKNTTTIKVHYQGKPSVSIDLARTILRFSIAVFNAAGERVGGPQKPRATDAPPQEPPTIGTINYLVGSAFQEVELELNGRNVGTSNNNYAQRSYLEVVMSYSSGSKNTWLLAGGFSSSHENSIPQKLSQASIREYGKYTVAGQLHLDLCHQHRHIIPNVNILLTFVLNPAKYVLHRVASDNAEYTYAIQDFSVFFLENTLTDAESMHIENMLVRSPALYPTKRVEVRSFHVSAGVTTFSEDNCFIGQLPSRLLITLVEDDCYTGTLASSPFIYKHLSLDQISMIVGNRHVPGLPLSVSQSDRNESYIWAIAGLGQLYQDRNIGMTPDEWLNNNVIYVFDVYPHMPPGCVMPTEQGNVRMQLRFRDSLAKATTVIVLAEFNNIIKIDKNRAVVSDF